MVTAEFRNAYRQARAHQWATYGRSVTTYPSGRTEYTGGSAVYDRHACAAFYSAKRAVHFRKTLAEDLKAHKRRSAAAKKAWKARRAEQVRP